MWYNISAHSVLKCPEVMAMPKNYELISDEMSVNIIEAATRIAKNDGADKVTVREILRALDITNRVFYNRFHNVEEVLRIVYHDMVLKIRESITNGFDPDGDYFEQITEIATSSLIMSYDTKMNFNQYVFNSDSVLRGNFEWWREEIKKLIEIGKQQGHLSESVNTDVMSYAIWCFIRGYNADAVGRRIPKDEAIKNFRYSFNVLLDGMRP